MLLPYFLGTYLKKEIGQNLILVCSKVFMFLSNALFEKMSHWWTLGIYFLSFLTIALWKRSREPYHAHLLREKHIHLYHWFWTIFTSRDHSYQIYLSPCYQTSVLNLEISRTLLHGTDVVNPCISRQVDIFVIINQSKHSWY